MARKNKTQAPQINLVIDDGTKEIRLARMQRRRKFWKRAGLLLGGLVGLGVIIGLIQDLFAAIFG